jgi:hypothetical protein
MRSIVKRKSWPGPGRGGIKCLMLFVRPVIERIRAERFDSGRI